jgi:hypothetical protein
LWNYEIRVHGCAGPAICAQFSDCEIDVEGESTTIRALVADQAALHGLLDRVRDVGIEIVEVRRCAGSPADPVDDRGRTR